MDTIDDLLPGPADPPLSVLFCGINPGLLTVVNGLHFGRPGNRFWPVLYGAGFTPRLLAAAEQRELAALGYGITALVARASARAQDLAPAELTGAVPGFTRRVSELRPRWVGFLGITAYRTAFRRPAAKIGRQDELLADAGLWVLPNPSGLNRSWQLPALTEEFGRLYQAAQNG
ncbi:MAG TPA: mismatch-specific DNA-glycosylase [Pseudonocardia sp.]|jgi:TDG/mug DNA glycosylase family protein|nr:mismatch-specific DNA-glycosylase [Pseudonocardia sp.]